jgi:hypothetical protein
VLRGQSASSLTYAKAPRKAGLRCPRRRNYGCEMMRGHVNDELRTLLESQNLNASEAARTDLESGRVDQRLVTVLARLIARHQIRVTTIKTGHPMGPQSPTGRDNDHYFYRAADITEIDGHPIESNPTTTASVDVGRMLMAMNDSARPVRVMGPAEWQQALGEGDRTGFRNDEFATSIHRDHLHIGF